MERLPNAPAQSAEEVMCEAPTDGMCINVNGFVSGFISVHDCSELGLESGPCTYIFTMSFTKVQFGVSDSI